MGKYGKIFLGKDEQTYGKDGIGHVDYDPDFECGGPPGTPGRQCPFVTEERHTLGLNLTGREGRNLHVNIASYRDPLCPRTLYNAFTKANTPEKLFIRVLQQRDPEVDGDCLEDYCKLMAEKNGKEINKQDILKDCPYASQVFIHEIHAKEAAGPTWARGLLSKDTEAAYKSGELNPQDHCMSLDSHMDFENHWDDRMVKMWDDALNEYAVLSTYVQDIEHLGEEDKDMAHRQVPHLCMIKYTSNVRTHATKAAVDLSKPKLTNAVWGAGLSFSKCHAELKVMVDPHTPHIFDGEEFNRAARFWTHGYDIYTPNHVYVLHDYHKSQSNPIMHTWNANKDVHGTFHESNWRLRTMIDLPGGEKDPAKALKMKQSKFGLGDRRSLDQLIQFSGFDLRNQRITIDGKNRCGNIQWVPFEEHPKGVNHIPSFDNDTEDPLEPYDPTSVWYQIGKHRNGGGDVEGKGKEDDESGIPPDMNLADMHAQLQEKVEAGEVANNGLDKKHQELMNQLSQEQRKDDTDKTVTAEDDAVKVEAVVTERKTAGPVHVGPLRGFTKLRDTAHDGAQVLSHLIAKNSITTSSAKVQHGFANLPTFVKVNVFLLIFGVVFAIIRSAGTGRAFKTNSKKREL